MIASPPYVVVVAAPSSGVGKSTLASNLAVYLKGLAEDLPVAYVSSDAEAIEAMFALPGACAGALSELSQDVSLSDLLSLGEFGVEFCYAGSAVASDSPAWLRKNLFKADFDGVLILDLAKDHPSLPAALWSADLLLAPVKDPSVLGALVALRNQFLAGGGCKEQFWLLPSELGAEGRYQRPGQLPDFLRFAAGERDFQVLGETYCVDLQVHEMAAAKAKPVLTRAPQSQLHSQLKQLAELVLTQRQQQNNSAVRVKRCLSDGLLPARAKRVAPLCAVCRHGLLGAAVHYLESFPSRKRLLLHRSCLAGLLGGTEAAAFMPTAQALLVQPGAAHGGVAGDLRLAVMDPELELLSNELLPSVSTASWDDLLRRATGRHPAELYRELLLISSSVTTAEVFDPQWYKAFSTFRGRIREVCKEEKI